MKNYKINNLFFKQYSSFAPEQYYIYKNKKQIGYIRLRHGILTACKMKNDEDIDFGNIFFYHEFEEKLPCFNTKEDAIFWLTIIANEMIKLNLVQ